MNIIKRLATGVVMLAGTWSAAGQEIIEYVHTDALGSPVAVSDAAGNVTERTLYEPYGATVGAGPSDAPGFTGHVADSATGLTYLQQRYLDSETGRFLSVDPVSALQYPVQTFNRYRYALNNPYRFADPDGRLDWEKMGDAFKLEGGVGLGLQATFKVGPAKISAGVGSASFGGGLTAAPDGYAFQEVAGPSAGAEFAGWGLGYKGSVERSYQGRHGLLYSEESSPAGGMMGRKRAELSGDMDGNSEVSASLSVFVGKLTAAVDLGKLADGLTSPSPAKAGTGGFQGVFRVQGRLDSKQLEKRMKGK